jgi:hypothetical protein
LAESPLQRNPRLPIFKTTRVVQNPARFSYLGPPQVETLMAKDKIEILRLSPCHCGFNPRLPIFKTTRVVTTPRVLSHPEHPQVETLMARDGIEILRLFDCHCGLTQGCPSSRQRASSSHRMGLVYLCHRC